MAPYTYGVNVENGSSTLPIITNLGWRFISEVNDLVRFITRHLKESKSLSSQEYYGRGIIVLGGTIRGSGAQMLVVISTPGGIFWNTVSANTKITTTKEAFLRCMAVSLLK